MLGMTFKENVPDTRNSKVADIVRELAAAGVDVQVHDPLASADEAKHEYGIDADGRWMTLKPGRCGRSSRSRMTIMCAAAGR